ncbi:hypothetical protein P7K49_020750, partial [Saguinus oedipus]
PGFKVQRYSEPELLNTPLYWLNNLNGLSDEIQHKIQPRPKTYQTLHHVGM